MYDFFCCLFSLNNEIVTKWKLCVPQSNILRNFCGFVQVIETGDNCIFFNEFLISGRVRQLKVINNIKLLCDKQLRKLLWKARRLEYNMGVQYCYIAVFKSPNDGVELVVGNYKWSHLHGIDVMPH